MASIQFLLSLVVCLLSSMALAQKPLSLEDFLKQANRQNLEIGMEESRLKQLQANALGIRIPEPMVAISEMRMEDGGKARGWEVSQAIPFPTKITSDYSSRKHQSKAQELKLNAEKQRLLSNARFVYFLVWAAQRDIEILNEKKAAIRAHLPLARALGRSDTFARIHALKAEAAVDEIDNELEAAKQMLRERQAYAAAFINEDPLQFQFVASEPKPSVIQDFEIDKTPQVESIKYELKSFESLETKAKSAWLPDFNFRYSYMEATPMFPENNTVMIGVALPFAYFWQPYAESQEFSAKSQEAKLRLNQETRWIAAEKVRLNQSIESIKNQLATINNKLLPNAQKRKKLFSHNVAPRDLSTLQEHLDTILAVPDLNAEALRLRTAHEQSMASLSQYISQDGAINEK